jgi:ribosomal protein S27E
VLLDLSQGLLERASALRQAEVLRLPDNSQGQKTKEEGKPMEKRKEYADGEIITCPKCGGDDLDYDDAPAHAKCNSCGLAFTIKTVVIWEE